MSTQTEITSPTPLLNPDGSLHAPGYCRRNLYQYNREAIAAPKWRIKEWDYYQVGDRRCALQLCFANIGLGAAGTATLIDLEEGTTVGAMGLALATTNRFLPPRNGDVPYTWEFEKGGMRLSIEATEEGRVLDFSGKRGKFAGHITLAHPDKHESITIATPFAMPGRFFYTQKLNCMPAQGSVLANGKTYEFGSDSNSFGVMDWGRGAWPHKNMWYWGNGSTLLNGKRFGFEITWGFGDDTHASETALFYDGTLHKLGRVDVRRSPRGHWMEPWEFYEENGRFELTMTPFYDHATGVKVLGLVGARCHQVHGLWNGTVTLDDGEKLEIKDMYAFCERMENLW